MQDWLLNFFYLHKTIFMKKRLIIAVVVFLSVNNFCLGQEKIEKYCEVTVIGQRVSINFGNPNNYFKDSTVKNSLLAVIRLKNSVDVLDYMSKIGWDIVSISSVGQFNAVRIIYFKKEFYKSEFTIDRN